MDNDTTLPEPRPEDTPLWLLRQNLIDLTIALADELAVEGDRDRLQALAALYQTTRDALRQRDLRLAR
jgi:hypothetical protein